MKKRGKTQNIFNLMALLYFVLLSACFTASKARRIWTAMEGEAFVVECPEADLDEYVTWHFAETDISTDKGERVHSSGINLWFLPTAPQDSGNYTCKYKDSSNESETVSITIHPYKEGNCYHEDALYVESIGSPGSGKISCPSFRDYNNASDVKWYKDCQYIQTSKYKTKGRWLYISHANQTDNGVYTCKFTYSHGGKKFNVSASRNFRTKVPPSPTPIQVYFPKDNDVIYTEIGVSKNLSCKAWLGAGKQSLGKSFWTYNHYQNEPNRFVQYTNTYMETDKGQFTEAILTILKVEKKDFNVTFSCFLMNDRGYKIVNIRLRHKVPTKERSTHLQVQGLQCLELCHSNILLLVGFTLLLVAIAIVMMLYQFFRIDIVLFCRRKLNCTEFKDDGKIYDAYVICPTNHINGSSEKKFMSCFVHQILPEVLENQYGYKLCIYGRDVLPGEGTGTLSYILYGHREYRTTKKNGGHDKRKDVIDAVETRVKVSRRLIILITQSLVQSRDFAYEHQIAFYNVLIKNNVKVILLEMERMGDSGPAQLQESLRHIMNKQGTIKWKEKYMACPSSPHSNFWKHVEYQMPVRRQLLPTYSIV